MGAFGKIRTIGTIVWLSIVAIVQNTPVRADFVFVDPFIVPKQPAYVQPAGNFVYYTDPAGNVLGRLDPSTGSITEFSIPTAGARPKGIASDGAGNIWFVEQEGNKLASFDPVTGHITEYTVPTPNSRPTDLLVDSHGLIWVAELGASKIARFDPATAQFREFSTALSNASPNVPFEDAQGRIWWVDQGTNPHATEFLDFRSDPNNPIQATIFADPGQNRMRDARIPVSADLDLLIGTSLNNAVFTFDPATGVENLVSLSSPAHGIQLGPDGNGWFTENPGNMIGRVNPVTLALAEFPIPTPSSGTLDLEFDQNGVLWFAEGSSKKIGRFDPSTSTFVEFSTEVPEPAAAWLFGLGIAVLLCLAFEGQSRTLRRSRFSKESMKAEPVRL
jgi:virginiamycin B lyase